MYRTTCLLMLLTAFALPAEASLTRAQLASLSLEELGSIRITSVSKKAEPLSEAPASVFVITSEDIRRSGVTSLPEALRLAPNLHVARGSSGGYAISARGFNGSNTSAPNKLLVMIDGRSVYTPLFSGVFWDVQDLMLEDVERIEVISGPGSTLWGVNAVNGVINVVTRPAANSQGNLLVAGAGSRSSLGAWRHGGQLGPDGHYRVYGKYSDRKHGFTEAGDAVDDAGHLLQAGARADWALGEDAVSVFATIYDGSEGQPMPGAVSVEGLGVALDDVVYSGGSLTGRWDRQLADGGSLSLQAYYDHSRRVVPPMFSETLGILDLQFVHSPAPSERHALTWGANYRRSDDEIGNSPYFAFLPADLSQQWSSLFAQDAIMLRKDLRLTVGARLERNDYTGTEFLPSARLAWSPSAPYMLWAAISRGVRAPSRLDRDAFIPGVPPFLLDGGPHARSEVARVYEIGYRGQPNARLSLSATAYHADYDHLRTVELAPSQTQLVFANLMEGHTTGLELWGKFQATTDWRLAAGFTAMKESLRLKPGSIDAGAPLAAGNDPSNSWQLRSSWDIDQRRQFDLAVRHVAALARDQRPAYTAVDLNFGWRLRDRLDLSVSGLNLFGRHVEYGNPLYRLEIEPTVFVKLAWEH